MFQQRYFIALSSLLLGLALITSGCDPFIGSSQAANLKSGSPSSISLTDYVNPFIGSAPGGSHFGFTGNSGDTFPGAIYPLGMVQWSPDTPSNLPGGYNYLDHQITGFSLTHFSGRGCVVHQDFPFIPYIGKITSSPVNTPKQYAANFHHSQENAHPGYYAVKLDKPDVQVQLTATPHTGLAQFQYPTNSEAAMLINAGGSVKGNQDAHIEIKGQQIIGSTTSMVGCSDQPYTLYFAAHFDHPFKQSGTWQGKDLQTGSTTASGGKSGAYLTFDTTSQRTVRVQVGISYVSVANALDNLKREDSALDFAKAAQNAQKSWEQRLKHIQIQGNSRDNRVIFYTALYHTFIHPNIFNDANGQYLGFDNQVHTVPAGHTQFENIAGWDQYRTLIQLRALLEPQETSDIAQSLVNDAQQGDGHLPRWEQTNRDSHGMIGDDGAIVIANAYAFGATNFDTQGALQAIENGQQKVREGWQDEQQIGYVARDNQPDSAAITEEYSIDDFAIAQFAKSLHNQDLYEIYRQRSMNWQNLFNPQTGLIQPRDHNGDWSAGSLPDSQLGFREGSASQYNWEVAFDLPTLFQKMGGEHQAVERLNTFFTHLNEGPDSLYAFMGNEICFSVPWEYNFAGAPQQTQKTVRQVQQKLFKNAPNGLPGNDDGGSLSSWYVFSALGLYPLLPGTAGFVVSSPKFTHITIQPAQGREWQILASGDVEHSPYIQKLQAGSKTSQEVWLSLTDLRADKKLQFEVSGTPGNWGQGSRPPRIS